MKKCENDEYEDLLNKCCTKAVCFGGYLGMDYVIPSGRVTYLLVFDYKSPLANLITSSEQSRLAGDTPTFEIRHFQS